jgi:enterochelin esterase-like enzyme
VGQPTPFRQPFIETADAVFATGRAPGCIVVYVDAWTAYGGSQFVDSPGTGRYHSYLCDEVVPWVDANYRRYPARESRAVSGNRRAASGNDHTDAPPGPVRCARHPRR